MIDHFRLSKRPFTREIECNEHFPMDFLNSQVRELARCVEMRASGLIVAPAGMGKTSILRKLRAELPESQYKVSYLKVTNVSGRDLCREICTAIGAKTAGTYPAMVRSIQERMLQSCSESAIHPVIIFDDAHALRPHGFEALKCISNFEMDSKLAVSFVLAGHSSLKEKLYAPNLEDVRQRIVHCGQLRALSQTESTEYISHRMQIVGAIDRLFSAQATEGIYLASRGNMRGIDNIALKALTHAAEQKSNIVEVSHVIAARNELWT